MSETDVPTPTGSRWQRFADKLSGGPPNLEKLQRLKGKPWYVRYNVTLFMLAGCFAVLVAPEVVNQLNGVPNSAALQTAQVRILRTAPTEPHLLAEFSDGRQLAMEWPVTISFLGGFRSHVWSEDERQRLPGCLAIVRGVQLNWTVNNRFRVWSLDCPEREVRVGISETARKHESDLKARLVIAVIVYIPFFLFVLVIYLREKRGTL